MSRSHPGGTFDDTDTEPWQFIVLRSQNFNLLRPEKSWRPIVTLEVDGHHTHEIVLGTDGQNPNQRMPMLLREAHHGTQIRVGIWHKSQSKSKSKGKRRLVASTSLPLGEAVKKQGNDRHLEIRLSNVTPARRNFMAQKQHLCASLLVRLRAPSTSPEEEYNNDDGASVTSSVGKPPSDTLVTPTTEANEHPPPWAEEDTEESTLLGDPPNLLRRRRRIKGYCIDSADEQCTSESDEDEDMDAWADSKSKSDGLQDEYYEYDTLGRDHDTTTLQIRSHARPPSTISIVFPSYLPFAYVSDTMSVSSSVSLATSVFDAFTYYRELRDANIDSDLEEILKRLMHEWYYVGASLLSVAALDTTVFGFSPDSIFGVDGLAKRTLTISAVAAALGLGLDAWFLLIYSGADVRRFQTMAVDLYSSYFFFSLTSRLPLLALFLSILTLTGFLVAIAFAAWPAAVLVMCAVAGVLISLQFIVYGAHRLVLGGSWAARAVWRALVRGARAADTASEKAAAVVPPPAGAETRRVAAA